MGKRGPRPTPTSILSARGSWRARTRPNEPRPETKRPPCPRRLGKAQRSVWSQLIKMLFAARVVTEWDRYGMERYCDLLVQYRGVADTLNRVGMTFEEEGSQGQTQLKARPEVAIQKTLVSALLKLEQEFGLTPSARARIVVDVPEREENDKARFFKGKVAG